MKSKKFPFFHGLGFLYTCIVFLILCFTFLLSALIIMLAVHFNIITQHNMPNISGFFLFIILLSIFIGTSLSSLAGRIFLKPIRQIIHSADELACGNFSIRVPLRQQAELKELAISFNHMAEELENTEILRSDFVNNFSHEFKTPIISIRGFARLLKNPSLSEEERQEYLDIIIAESSRLSSLSTNVLNLSKVENQHILTNTCTFRLDEQIRRCILLLENKWSAKELDLRLHLGKTFYYGDEDLLSQIWLNLLDNAIKFSPVKGKISLSLEVNTPSSAVSTSLLFKITNEGEPITPSALPHIFDKFFQGDCSHATDGNGLGLSLVKKVVELHHGTITVTSDKITGTSFFVTLRCTMPDDQSVP